MNSILSFDHYDVLETEYKYNPFQEDENNEISPNFKLVIKYNDKTQTEATLIFSVELGEKELEKHSFYIKAVVMGNFSLDISEKETNREKLINDMYKKNALAILYPYVRSLVTDLSSRGSEMPLTLPPINISAMVENEQLIAEEYKI